MFDLHAITMGLLASVGADLIRACFICHRLATDVLARTALSDLAREALNTCIRGTGRPPTLKIIYIQSVETISFDMTKRDTL